ncbi:unnamed protein product, partial [Mesorhabditis spiculigera]
IWEMVYIKYPREWLAMAYREFDVVVNDIHERQLKSIGQCYGVEHLGAAVFPTPAFPVAGRIHSLNLRYMVPLVCQRDRKPDWPIVNVWFMIDTASPYTSITLKTKKALWGAGEKFNEEFGCYVAIQDQNTHVECKLSKATFFVDSYCLCP